MVDDETLRALATALPEVIQAAPERFLDDDHYRGYPAVLVRLEAIEVDELAGLLRTAWTIVAPKSLVKAHP